MVERAYREVSRQDERGRADRERLELIARGKPKPEGRVATVKSGCGKLSRHSAANRNWTERLPWRSPHRATSCSTLRVPPSRRRWRRRAPGWRAARPQPAAGLAEAFSLGDLQEFAACREASTRRRPTPEPYVNFEAMVLQTFVQSMMPKEADAVYGEGMAGDMWKSMMSQQLGTVMADRGGIGIADSLLKDHYLEGETKVALSGVSERPGEGSARPGAQPVDGAGPGNAAAADIGHRRRDDAVDGRPANPTRGGRHARIHAVQRRASRPRAR